MSKACYDCPNNVTDCFRPHCISADGIQRSLYVANRQLPGPAIEVCHGDIIVVDVRNVMLSESTAIHFHGVKQKGTPYMDGVPYVTQCPILPLQTFRYTFEASDHGTFFWHSHIGHQRADGLFGAMVVYPKTEEDLSAQLYDDDDHYMIINDWSQYTGDAEMIKAYYHESATARPTNILVNGLGRQINNIYGAKVTNTPVFVFNVQPNKKNRFRLINAGSEDCPIEVSVDDHTLTVISLDSQDIIPVEVDSITIWPGERVDFILRTDKKIGNYWIRYRGYGLCQNTNATTNQTNPGVFQVAVLRYVGAPNEEPDSPIGYDIPVNNNTTRVLNPYQKGTEDPPFTNINIPQLVAAKSNDLTALTPNVDQQIYINFDFYPLNNYDFHRKSLFGFYEVPPHRRIGTLQLNNISLKLKSFPLLSQRNQIKPGDLCNVENIPKHCTSEHCACTHVIPLRLNAVVELVFVDEGKYVIINHPFHLHGHFFRIVATENLQGNITIDRVKELDRQGKIKRNLINAPYKDTMKAPGGGYSIVRFVANNPGYWLFHCHFEQHDNIGMALVFKVGEHKTMPPVPKNFPTCGDYEPEIPGFNPMGK
ncbi:laccase-1-like [Copidosoma floridanum]|uniref:laccase-1-like n=1 Tax=Copidosoma floridanum TaxID=29053 RepID=UPI0006C97291|nr:laccase-1-like [Copidosoma floridanum]